MGFILHAAALVALLAAAFVLYRGIGGSSPIAWLDTFNDQSLVEHCLEDGVCTRQGVQTSIRGVFHGVSWLDLRTLAACSGATLDQVLLIIQILNAGLLVMVFVLGTRLARVHAAHCRRMRRPNQVRKRCWRGDQ